MRFYKKIVIWSLFLPMGLLQAQDKKDQVKPNWQNLDLKKDGVFGISTERAYELVKGMKSTPVIVAVIDGGIDEDHEDLKSVMWKNEKEIAGNNKDDDNNGYIDDVYGWNFLGSNKGSVQFDNLELTRLIRVYQSEYAAVLNSTRLTPHQRKEFTLYKKLITEQMYKLENARVGGDIYKKAVSILDSLERKKGKTSLSKSDLEDYKAESETETRAIKVLKSHFKEASSYAELKEDVQDISKTLSAQLNYHLNLEFDPRDSIGDNYKDSRERFYGNNDVSGQDPLHGTHVAGIIAADRTNNKGIKGIANNVRILAVRTVPNGDERDKDVANAIRYAVDNGAKVINMSFGKSFSWDKAIVDSAVKYAESKDVLLVHAAGNDGKNVDFTNNFPNRYYQVDTGNVNFVNLVPDRREMMLPGQGRPQTIGMGGIMRNSEPPKPQPDTVRFKGSQAKNWIEVGAINWKNDDNLVAEFSNYGQYTVDVFAPGVKINSTIPGSKYKEEEGTSMASPMVAGLAALIRSYYPNLKAEEVRDIIMKSVTKVDQKVKVKDTFDETVKVKLSEISVSGGVVNAYTALQMAAERSK